MKAFKKVSIFALSAVFLVGCVACGQTPSTGGNGSENEGSGTASAYIDPNTALTTYNNRSYNEYLLRDEAVIENQWAGYGIGDPFVMRWNGMYYLYCSTLDREAGVRGYQSADLVNWVPMTGEGLKEGYVSQDNITLAAYAPEVYYFNGIFYMYTSPGGNGHYVLTATNPEGPFVKATDNFKLSIDGSVLIDDDEQMYFTFAGNTGIRMAKMTDMLHVDASLTPTLNGAGIGGWTEGPYILKKDGTYFLTYTGNHVNSDGYRIAYSTSQDISGRLASAFTRAQNNPLALETETELKGIGHSSTVMGPDMDSYYLVYHYLNSSGGPNRSLGIDRLTFNGTMMSVAPTLDGSVTPALPAFYATRLDEDKFETANEFTLSNTAAPANFTAEYNVSGVGTSTYVFSYIDANNYIDVTVDLTAKTVKLNKTENGMTMEIGAGTLVNDFAADKLHTIRVAARDGVVDVVFDNMTKIDDASLATVEGKIGYKSLAAEATIGYTAYSNVAMGMSDQREAKQATGFVGAADYLYDDTYAVSAKLSEGAIHTITSDDDSRLNGWKALTLKASGDQASYLVYNKTTGRYGLELVYRNSDGGKKIGVKVDGVDGGTVYRCTLPTIESDDMYVKAVVGEFDLKAGARIIRLENVGSEIDFAAFTFVETSSVAPVYENALSGYAQKGADYKTIWKIKEGGHYAKAGTRQLVYFGDNTITDFTLEVEIMLEGASGTSNAGIVFHAQNYAASSHDDYRSIQGYYVALSNNSVLLERYCYADSSQQLAAYAKGAETVTSDTFHKLKIEARGNVYTISLDGEQIFKVTDGWGFASGKVGLYTYGAAVVFKNLKISG